MTNERREKIHRIVRENARAFAFGLPTTSAEIAHAKRLVNQYPQELHSELRKAFGLIE